MKPEELLYKLITHELTPEESHELEQLFNEKPEYKEIFERITNNKNLHTLYLEYTKTDLHKALQKNIKLRRKSKSFNIIRYSGWAASLLIVCGIALYLMRKQSVPSHTALNQIVALDSMPQMSTEKDVHLIVESASYAVSDSVELNRHEKQQVDKNKLLRLVVGTGNSFQFKLPDGSQVVLNAGSEIIYPVDFEHDKREITIAGEVYMDVVKDSTRPFIVNYGENNQIKVLGTSFNIKAYLNEQESFVTLVSGKIEYKSDRRSVILKPAQQLVRNRETGEIKLNDVDPNVSTAWLHNKFMFRYETLENIGKELSRWYGVRFKFENHADKRFSGGFSKYDSIEKILTLLSETTQINFSIQDSCILVR